MIEDITLHAYNEMVNPILLCEMSGKVIYKNPEAQKQLRKPIRGGKIIDYLSCDSRKEFVRRVSEDGFPCFWEVESEGNLFCAFVDTVYYERRPVLLFVFSHLFLYEPALPLFVTPPSELREVISGEKLSNLITHLYTSDGIVAATRNKDFHKKMTQVYYKLMDTFLTEIAYGTEKVQYSLAHTLALLRYSCDKVLSFLGLDVCFHIEHQDADSTLVDFKTMMLLASNVILLAAEISDSHMVDAFITQEDMGDDVIFSFKLQVKKPHALIPFGGTGSFAELLPGRSVDLYFFDKICKHTRYHFGFTLNPKEKQNLCLRLQAPVSHRVRVQARDLFCFEDAVRMIDTLAALYLQELEDENADTNT